MSDPITKPGVKAVGARLLLRPDALLRLRRKRTAAVNALASLFSGTGHVGKRRRQEHRRWARQWVASAERWAINMALKQETTKVTA